MTLRDAAIRIVDLWDQHELAPHPNADITHLSAAFAALREALVLSSHKVVPSDVCIDARDIDFHVMLSSGGEDPASDGAQQFMAKACEEYGTHVVEILDCEGNLVGLAPRPTAEMLVDILNAHSDEAKQWATQKMARP